MMRKLASSIWFTLAMVLLLPKVAFALPNLTPYQPSGWAGKIVVSKVTGTHTNSTGLTVTDTLYVDFAVANIGSTATIVPFDTELYLDNKLIGTFLQSASLMAGYWVGASDFSLGKLSAGTHTLKIVVDSTGIIIESNESDNTYTKTITVGGGLPNLTPYQPSGWSDKIVVSKETGTNTDSTGLTATDTLYVDWAVINSGSSATGVQFYTALYLDNSLIKSWPTDPPLNADHSIQVTDYSLGTLSDGTHTLKIVTDSSAAITESSESDNEYTKTITVGGSSAPIVTAISSDPHPPIAGQQYAFGITGTGFDANSVEVFFVGPGCATATSCVVANGALTQKGTTAVGGVTTLPAGTFTVQVRNGSSGPASNQKSVYVAAHPNSSSHRVLILLADFPDKPGQATRDYFDAILFGDHPPQAPQGSLRDYYKEVSYGVYDVDGSVNDATIAWIRLPQVSTYYAGDCYGTSAETCSAVYPHNAQKMIEDAVIAARNIGLDFGPFDADGDGYVDMLFVIHSGQGADTTRDPNDIRSHSWKTFSPVSTGSTNAAGNPVSVLRYTTEPEFNFVPGDMTFGVFAHEYGHGGLGLPDLYDTDDSSEGVGYWSLMASGNWNGSPAGSSPSHLNAWSKYAAGFVTPTRVTSPLLNHSIQEAETTKDIYQLLNGSAISHTGEYFLVENREQTGFDLGLPSSGLLIWHIDEAQSTNRNENYPGCTICTGHYKVSLEQADSKYDLEKGTNRGDAGDPYPGVCGGTACNGSFTATTEPNSMLWNDQPSSVSITNISAPGPTMTASLAVSVTPTYTLSVNSSNPASGVDITVSPADNSGQSSGSTSFTRTYNQNTSVTLTAPDTAAGNNFSSWANCDSVSGYNCTVNMTVDKIVTANYGSATATVTVTPASSSITSNDSLRVTISVTGSSGTPTGTVTLSSGSYTSSPTTLSSGAATIIIPAGSLSGATSPYTATLTATYSGDSVYAQNTGSATVTVIAEKTTPTVTVSPSSSNITTAEALTVTVTVNGGMGNPTPTGSVTLSGGGYASAATALSSGSATINIPEGSLSTGSVSLTADYTPDSSSSSTYNSASGSATVTVTTPTYSLTATSVDVSRGASGTSTITATSTDGYAGTISFTCSVISAPANANHVPTCTSSNTITLDASTTTGTVSVTVSTTAPSTSAFVSPKMGAGEGWSGMAGGGLLAALMIFWLPKRRQYWRLLLGIVIIAAALGAFVGCGGDSPTPTPTTDPGTTTGTYTVQVKGTGNGSANTTATTTFTLTVN